MKKIIFILPFLFLLFSIELFAQDAPSGYTTHYGLREWAENANPAADSLNQNWKDIDRVLYDLILTLDTKQFVIRNDTLAVSDSASGKAAFSGTDTSVTVTVPGLDSLDVVVVTAEGWANNNNLSVYPTDGSFDVRRVSSGAVNGLKFNWVWIRKYQ